MKTQASFVSVIARLSMLIAFFMPTAVQAIEIQEIKSSKGYSALLVEDYTLPIISISYSFEGGSGQDAVGKEGTVGLMRALMDEGAGELDSAAFRAKLEEFGIEMGFSNSQDTFTGGMRTLVSEKATAFEMLGLALNEPRFDDEAIERMRDAIRTSLIRAKTNPSAQGGKARREAMFPEHPYGRSSSGYEASIDAITRADLIAMHKKLLSKEGLAIGVVGAINAEDLKTALDQVFGSLRDKTDLQIVENVEPILSDTIKVDMPVPNASLTLVYKGIKRDHPDFFAAFLMNHVLGGGSFTSRLHTEVREKRGLVYGVSSGIVTAKHAAYLITGTSTRNENRDEALDLMKSIISDVAVNGITQEELDAAKLYVKGSYAINNLDTSSKIARVLVGLQTQNLGLNYIDDRVKQIDAVTLEDVNRMAKQLLMVEPLEIIVGPE